jgi:hypothetical protein
MLRPKLFQDASAGSVFRRMARATPIDEKGHNAALPICIEISQTPNENGSIWFGPLSRLDAAQGKPNSYSNTHYLF